MKVAPKSTNLLQKKERFSSQKIQYFKKRYNRENLSSKTEKSFLF
jgi:hypothetical protein